MRIFLLVALASCSVLSSLPATTIVIGGPIQNGNFETPGYYWGGSRNWDGQYITDPASAFEGARFLQGSSTGQRFFVYPENGLAFELSFHARAGAAPLDEIIATFASPNTATVPQLTLGETPPPSTTWQRYTATFVFDQPWKKRAWYLDIEFLHEGAATVGQIDAVTLRQVPEPNAASILLCGAFALAARRWPTKRRSGQPAARSMPATPGNGFEDNSSAASRFNLANPEFSAVVTTMRVVAITVILLAIAPLSKAAIVNVKFGDNVYTGGGVAGDSAFWNYYPAISGSTLASLFDAEGNATNISIQVTYGSRFGGDKVSGNTPAKLLWSGLYGPFSFVITGLEPTESYDIYTFHHDKAGRATTTELIGSSIVLKTPTATLTSTYFNEGGNYLNFSNFSPSSDGQIVGSSSIAWGGLNGIQVLQVPEPSTIGMIACSLGLVSMFRRRKLTHLKEPLLR